MLKTRQAVFTFNVALPEHEFEELIEEIKTEIRDNHLFSYETVKSQIVFAERGDEE